ncbi:hypothetical protein ACWDYH_15250 [Nocardia goodfellowii]
MEREHEEAMRTDFTTYSELGQQMSRPSVTDREIQYLDLERQFVAERWEAGPHAEHWNYLEEAYRDFDERPDTMRRFCDNLDHNDGFGLTDVQRRSLEQARTLTEASRHRPERTR